MPRRRYIPSARLPQYESAASRLTSFLDELGRAGKVQHPIDPMVPYSRTTYRPFSPAQQAWGAGLVTGVGGLVDIFGKYPGPPSGEASFSEMSTADTMPSAKEHWQTGHPWIAGAQMLGIIPFVPPAAAIAKPIIKRVAASKPAQAGIATVKDTPAAEKVRKGIEELSMTRREFIEKTGAVSAGIAGLGIGIEKMVKPIKAKAAATTARVAGKAAELTHRADIHKFHDWITNMTVAGREGSDFPLAARGKGVTTGHERTRAVVGETDMKFGPQVPREAGEWLDEYGLDVSDFHLLDGEDVATGDWARTEDILNSLEDPSGTRGSVLTEIAGEQGIPIIKSTPYGDANHIRLYERHGVPILSDGDWRVFVPNEVGLQKLELHQLKQVMGDDLPDYLEEGVRLNQKANLEDLQRARVYGIDSSLPEGYSVYGNSNFNEMYGPGDYLEDLFAGASTRPPVATMKGAKGFDEEAFYGLEEFYSGLEEFYSLPKASK